MDSNTKRLSVAITLLWLLLAGYNPLASAINWPQQVEATEGAIVVYQPQPESLVGNVLSGRAAMSLVLNNQEQPIFGAFWFTAKLDTDKDAGTALVRGLEVTQVTWPDATDANRERFTRVLESAIPNSGFNISLERLSASLADAEREQQSLEQIKNDPPNIVFREQLSVLLLFDGEPRFSPVDNSDYERALNTPLLVVRRKNRPLYYLSSGNLWYHATDPLGDWSVTDDPPQDLVALLPEPEDDSKPAKIPAIVAATKPTELVSSDGPPEWKSLPGGELLYVENTETPWLRELQTGEMYVLLSGRWFRAKSADGNWQFVRADQLPASFKNIPPDSDIGGLRSSVADTPEANEAMLDAYIPQTAAIKRSEATLEVAYDGTPKFEKISGTNVSYAVNTGSQVLQIDGKYYAVDNGVWFVSDNAQGPWVVADTIPEDEIDKIPPSSPVYNTTHVTIYDSTPDIVYVGYTPGYLWSFPYYGVPVYGTGWYYPPWFGGIYYPRPPTWGFHVGYNPWTGWNFGVSWTNGFFTFGASWSGGWYGPYRPWGCCGGWYGGGYHRPPVVINTGNINIGNTINVGNRTHIGNRIDSNNLNNNRRRSSHNIYNRPENRARTADRTTIRQNLKQAQPLAGRQNNVYADRNGNLARRVNGQWEARDQGQWQSLPAGGTRNNAGSSINRGSQQVRERLSSGSVNRPAIDRSSLNSSFQHRQIGMAREMRRPMQMQGPDQMPGRLRR